MVLHLDNRIDRLDSIVVDPIGTARRLLSRFPSSSFRRGRGSPTAVQQYNGSAKELGYYQLWRKQARQQTGSGGAGGVDINMLWPA